MKPISIGSPIPLAWALMIASLLLPAINLLDSPINGSVAMYAALSEGDIYGKLSALSNAVFLATAVVFFRRNRTLISVLAGLITTAFFFNCWWLVQTRGVDLMIGYYVWLAAFAVMSVGLFVLLRSSVEAK